MSFQKLPSSSLLSFVASLSLSSLSVPANAEVRNFQSKLSQKQTFARQYVGVEAKVLHNHLKTLVIGSGFKWRDSAGAVNVVLLRGFDLECGPNKNEFNRYNDTMFIASFGKDSRHHVQAVRCTTESGGTGWEKKPFARMIPGQYSYEAKPGTHNEKKGALRPRDPIPVNRDYNYDGRYSTQELAKLSWASDLNIHWVDAGADPFQPGKWSLGCIVVPCLYDEFKGRITPAFARNTASSTYVTLFDTTKLLGPHGPKNQKDSLQALTLLTSNKRR